MPWGRGLPPCGKTDRAAEGFQPNGSQEGGLTIGNNCPGIRVVGRSMEGGRPEKYAAQLMATLTAREQSELRR
jgi:hypothetical protein